MAVQTISPAHFHEQAKRWEHASLMTGAGSRFGIRCFVNPWDCRTVSDLSRRDCRYSARRGLAVSKRERCPAV